MTLSVVGAAYGGTVAVRLMRVPRRSRPDHLLASMFLLVGAAAVSIAMQREASLALIQLLERVEYAIGFSAGPLLWLYVRAVAGVRSSRLELGHFLPALASLLLPERSGDPLFGTPIEVMLVHQMTYTSVSAGLRVRSRDRFSGVHQIWTRNVLLFMIVVHVASIVRNATAALSGLMPFVLSAGALALGALAIGLGGRGPRQRRPRLPASGSADLVGRLRVVIERDALYLDPELRLPEVAALLEISPQELSSALNASEGTKGWSSVLNEYRVNAAKEMLLDPESAHLSIEGIAMMSGFGSRSAFYEVFRKSEGVSPGEYRKSRTSS